MRLPKLKQCKMCYKYKAKTAEYFRIIDAPRNHTSKTCRRCEILLGVDQADDAKESIGYLYVLFDEDQPDKIKIGYTTNREVRLHYYNQKKSSSTCAYVYTSQLLGDIYTLEQILLKRIRTYADTFSASSEWFPIKYKEILIAEIKRAEEIIINPPEDLSKEIGLDFEFSLK